MRKLTDMQVHTLMFILAHEPRRPEDMSRFHAVQLLLDYNIVRLSGDYLVVDTRAPELALQYIYPALMEDCTSFEELESRGLLVFRTDAEPRPEDTFFYWGLHHVKRALQGIGGDLVITIGDTYDTVLPKDPRKKIIAASVVTRFFERHTVAR